MFGVTILAAVLDMEVAGEAGGGRSGRQWGVREGRKHVSIIVLNDPATISTDDHNLINEHFFCLCEPSQ